MLKQPSQFKELFKGVRPLDEDIGEAMAKWADGTPAKPRSPIGHAFDATCAVSVSAESVLDALGIQTRDQLTEEHRAKLSEIYKAAKAKNSGA